MIENYDVGGELVRCWRKFMLLLIGFLIWKLIVFELFVSGDSDRVVYVFLVVMMIVNMLS